MVDYTLPSSFESFDTPFAGLDVITVKTSSIPGLTTCDCTDFYIAGSPNSVITDDLDKVRVISCTSALTTATRREELIRPRLDQIQNPTLQNLRLCDRYSTPLDSELPHSSFDDHPSPSSPEKEETKEQLSSFGDYDKEQIPSIRMYRSSSIDTQVDTDRYSTPLDCMHPSDQSIEPSLVSPSNIFRRTKNRQETSVVSNDDELFLEESFSDIWNTNPFPTFDISYKAHSDSTIETCRSSSQSSNSSSTSSDQSSGTNVPSLVSESEESEATELIQRFMKKPLINETPCKGVEQDNTIWESISSPTIDSVEFQNDRYYTKSESNGPIKNDPQSPARNLKASRRSKSSSRCISLASRPECEFVDSFSIFRRLSGDRASSQTDIAKSRKSLRSLSNGRHRQRIVATEVKPRKGRKTNGDACNRASTGRVILIKDPTHLQQSSNCCGIKCMSYCRKSESLEIT